MNKLLCSFLSILLGLTLSACSQFSPTEQETDYPVVSSSESQAQDTTAELSNQSNDNESAEISEGPIYSEMIMEYLSFEDAVKQANICLEAVYKGRIDGTQTFQEVFEVDSVLFGSCDEIEIHVYYSYASVDVVNEKTGKRFSVNTWEQRFAEGERYLLILDKVSYLFYDYPRYLPYLGLLLAEDENTYTLWDEPIIYTEGSIKETIKTLREGISDEQPYNPVLNPAPIQEGKDPVETMILNSRHVGLIKLTAVENSKTDHHGRVYRAEIVELFTKETMDLYEDGSFLIVLDRDRTEAGEIYLCGFDPTDEGSRIYTQMTREGVFPASSEDLIKEAKELLQD